MTETFADAAVVTQYFYRTMTNWGVIIAVGILLLWVMDRGRPASLPFAFFLLAGCAGFVVVSAERYFNNVDRFVSLTIAKSELRLEYPGPLGGVVRIPTTAVKNTLFGLANMRGPGLAGACYITFELANDKTHRSAPRTESIESCKALRDSIIRAIKQ